MEGEREEQEVGRGWALGGLEVQSQKKINGNVFRPQKAVTAPSASEKGKSVAGGTWKTERS